MERPSRVKRAICFHSIRKRRPSIQSWTFEAGKGESSLSRVDREWPQQIILPADECLGQQLRRKGRRREASGRVWRRMVRPSAVRPWQPLDESQTSEAEVLLIAWSDAEHDLLRRLGLRSKRWGRGRVD